MIVLLNAFLRTQLAMLKSATEAAAIGTVISLGDGIARIYGCESCLAGELLEFADGTLGLALAIESTSVVIARVANLLWMVGAGNLE